MINAGFFAHAKTAAFGDAVAGSAAAVAAGSLMCGINSVWHYLTTDPRCLLSSLYFAIFGVVIALMKDVPDVKGDEISNIRTFSVRLGQKRVFGWMRRLLSTSFVVSGLSFWKYALLPVDGPITPPSVRVGRFVAGLAAIACGRSVEREAKPVDPEDPKQVYEFYMHLWKLFYLSYLVLPFAR